MWVVRWAACVALVASSVLGEPRLSFHPPVYLYEFGDLGEQRVEYMTVGHIRPGQSFAKVDLKAVPCVRRERFVRIVVLNAHNPARVSLRPHALYIHYARQDHTASTYIVWTSRAGPQDPACLHRLRDMLSDHRRRLVQYPMAMHPRQGYPLKHGHYPGHVISHSHGRRGQWSAQDDDTGNHVEGRNGAASTKKNARESEEEDSHSEESSESSKEEGDERKEEGGEPNNEALKKEHGQEKNEAIHEPTWKLKRQRKNKLNEAVESKSPIDNVQVQDIEDPINITETVKFGINRNIFRRTSPLRTVKEEIIEEYITPEQTGSQSTVPSGMSVIPGFTYQFFNLPSSSEATAMNLPSPDLPKDQSEWNAYFKNLIDSNSSMIVTEIPVTMLAAAAAPIVP